MFVIIRKIIVILDITTTQSKKLNDLSELNENSTTKFKALNNSYLMYFKITCIRYQQFSGSIDIT